MFTGTDPMKFIRFDKMLRPDLNDPEFQLLSKRFKEHGVVVDPYDRGTGKYTRTNVFADPELERRLKYFYSWWAQACTTTRRTCSHACCNPPSTLPDTGSCMLTAKMWGLRGALSTCCALHVQGRSVSCDQ